MSNLGSTLLDGVATAGGIYSPMGDIYASDGYVAEARNEGWYVGQGCAISASGTAGKVDMSAGTILIGTTEVAVAAVAAFATTITTLASGLTSGQALWVACEVDVTGTLNFNSGSAAQSDATHSPVKPTPTSSRVVVAWLFVPFGATAVDALTGNSNAKAKILEARQLVPGPSPSGWQYDQNTWVFVSATSFKIVGVDARPYLKKGDRVSYNDGGLDYGVIASVAFSTDTTVTLIVNTDYTIANATLIRPRFSYQQAPQGFPTWFNYNAAVTGFSAAPASPEQMWRTNGNEITVIFSGPSGTSNATTITFTLPIAMATTNIKYGVLDLAFDNGAFLASPGAYTVNLIGVLTAYKTLAQGAWTGSGLKAANFTVTFKF